MVKDKVEYDAMFGCDEDLVTVIRKNIEINPDAIENFLEDLRKEGFSEEQI